MTALDLQRRYYAAVEAFITNHDDALVGSLPVTGIKTVMGEWHRALDALDHGEYDALADRVDWAARSVYSTHSGTVDRMSPSPSWNSLSSITTTSPMAACMVH